MANRNNANAAVANVNGSSSSGDERNGDPPNANNHQGNQGGESLRDFISQRYQEQKDAGLLSNDVSEERTNQFFQRAMSESQRMSAEVNQSEQTQAELYRELGQENVHSWTMEHASEVTVTLPEQNGHHGPVLDN